MIIEHVTEHTIAVAKDLRDKSDERLAKINSYQEADKKIERTQPVQYGFTVICNNCGHKANLGTWSKDEDGGPLLHCTNVECKQKEKY